MGEEMARQIKTRLLQFCLLWMALLLALLSGCARSPGGPDIGYAQAGQMETPSMTPGITPSPTIRATSTPVPTPTHTATQPASPILSISPALPEDLLKNLHLPETVQLASHASQANLWLGTVPPETDTITLQTTYWVYALAAPFPTVQDGVSLRNLRSVWKGQPPKALNGLVLLVSHETKNLLESAWGPADADTVRALPPDQLLESAWQNDNFWAIVPFEGIEPRWKILRVDGRSPLDPPETETPDPLAVPVSLFAAHEIAVQWQSGSLEPVLLPTNRDPQKFTSLMITGVTALSRNIAARMESEGVTYPARDIGDWLRAADLTHISNEVSFFADCPPPRQSMRFCSAPNYIELLEFVGADIIELTGNHNLDWGQQPYLDTLEMYRERGWQFYGGGTNLEEAQRPLLIEHNGNRLAFLGCSPAGPPAVWADINSPGSAPCQMDALEEQLQNLRQQGYLPIFTFQHNESEWYVPPPAQGIPDFKRMARAGAVVVSGSQSHFPQTMTFVEDSFIHYGLGNLFFDQMEPKTIRQAFLDRHYFYDGRYLGVELLTTMLEDHSRPRPMTTTEREKLLRTVFDFSDWGP
jgi:hypothetical protein